MACSGPTALQTSQPAEPVAEPVADSAPTLDVHWPQRRVSLRQELVGTRLENSNGRRPSQNNRLESHSCPPESHIALPASFGRRFDSSPGVRPDGNGAGREGKVRPSSQVGRAPSQDRSPRNIGRRESSGPNELGRRESSCMQDSQGDCVSFVKSSVIDADLFPETTVLDPELRSRPEMVALVRWFEAEVKGCLLGIDAKLTALADRVSATTEASTRPAATVTGSRVSMLKKMGVFDSRTKDDSRCLLRANSGCSGRSTKPSERGGSPETSPRHVDKAEHAKKSPFAYMSGASDPVIRGHSNPMTASMQYLNDYRRHRSGTKELRMRFGDRFLRSEFVDRVWRFLEEPESSKAAAIYAHLMPIFILVTVVSTVLQSGGPPPLTGSAPCLSEIVVDAIFLAEVLVRWAVSPRPLLFLLGCYNLIDLTAVVSLTLRTWLLFGGDRLAHRAGLDLVRQILLCVTPTLRLLKLMRRFEKFHLLYHAFEVAFEALPVLLYTGTILLLSASAVIYACESRDNVDTFPRALWLGIATMSTVGYGDYYPVSLGGTLATSALFVCSALYMAIPLGIVGNAFNRVWEDRDRLLLMARTKKRLAAWGYTALDIHTFCQCYSNRSDGILEFNDFERMMAQMKLGLSAARVSHLFELFDDNCSGTIEPEEFVAVLFPGFAHEVSLSSEAAEEHTMKEGCRPVGELGRL